MPSPALKSQSFVAKALLTCGCLLVTGCVTRIVPVEISSRGSEQGALLGGPGRDPLDLALLKGDKEERPRSDALSPDRIVVDRMGRSPTDPAFDPTRGVSVTARYMGTLPAGTTGLVEIHSCDAIPEEGVGLEEWRVTQVGPNEVGTLKLYPVARDLDLEGRRPEGTISPLAIGELDLYPSLERDTPRSGGGPAARGLFDARKGGAYVIDRVLDVISARQAIRLSQCTIEVTSLPGHYAPLLSSLASANGVTRRIVRSGGDAVRPLQISDDEGELWPATSGAQVEDTVLRDMGLPEKARPVLFPEGYTPVDVAPSGRQGASSYTPLPLTSAVPAGASTPVHQSSRPDSSVADRKARPQVLETTAVVVPDTTVPENVAPQVRGNEPELPASSRATSAPISQAGERRVIQIGRPVVPEA